MSIEELKAYAKYFEDLESDPTLSDVNSNNDDCDISGGSLMGGARNRSQLMKKIISGGLLTGGLLIGGASVWIDFMKAYKNEHPKAKMPEIRAAYYKMKGVPEPQKKQKEPKKMSMEYLLSRHVKPTISREKKQHDYLEEVVTALEDKYNDPILDNLGHSALSEEEDFMDTLKKYADLYARIKKESLRERLESKKGLSKKELENMIGYLPSYKDEVTANPPLLRKYKPRTEKKNLKKKMKRF